MFTTLLLRNCKRTSRLLIAASLSFCLLASQSGCINTMVMVSKVLLGDPKQKSGFELASGVKLEKGEKRVLLRCTAPAFLAESEGSITETIEDELLRRMKRHEIPIVSSSKAAEVLDRRGGQFDPQVLAQEIPEVDYIFHIQLEKFTYLEGTSSNFYRGNASGRIVGYEVRGSDDGKHAVQIFDQNFHSTYPTTYPVSVESTPKNIFVRRFLDRLTDNLGTSFYSVYRTELYAN
ncbi:hypothetical protein SH668x_001097 [Planctomicrobium sp. SH668]|uniref:hypothetical protein n=1 Tax=Planctomicrobium sp. SH668 TaxID=3448126 RepID=UPI003F5BC649